MTNYEYDALGRRTVVTDASGIATYSTYDAAGRLAQTRDALGHVTQYGDDALGRQTVVTDGELRMTHYEYDAAGRLAAVVENYQAEQTPDSQTNVRTGYAYDALGNRRVITDALGHTTVYSYDGASRLVAQRDALGYVTAYGYDALGRRTTVVKPDRNGPLTTTTHYHPLGWVTRIDYPATDAYAAFTVHYAYDVLGHRTAMTDATGTTTWAYDAVYRVTQVTDPLTGTVAYAYDALGQRTALTVTTPGQSAQRTAYTYDTAGRLIQVQDWTTGTTTLAYDAAGRVLTATLPNGITTTYGYDGAGRLTHLTHTGLTRTLASYTYTLDALGRHTAETETLVSGAGVTVTARAITHTYDALGRQVGTLYSTGEAFAYTLDAAGNRQTLTSTTPLSGTQVTTYTYDSAGRLTGRNVSDGRSYTYTWTRQSQLLAEWTAGVPVRTFTYDGAGRMVQATVLTLTTDFVYNGLGARVAVSVAGQTTRYTLDYANGNRILAETTPTSTVSYLYGRDCLGELRDGAWLYYLHDVTGHVRQGTDTQEQVTGAWLFDPDGTVLEGPNGPVSHLVCGGVYDQSTGLIYQNGRYFDPNLGIWLALIPLVVVQAWPGRKKRRKGGQPWVVMLCVGVLMASAITACTPEEKENLQDLCIDLPLEENCPSCNALPTNGSELPFAPESWNNDTAIRESNNCYSYAANDRRIHKTQFSPPLPGVAGGIDAPFWFPVDCSQIGDRAQEDGFYTHDCETACPVGQYKVMAFASTNATQTETPSPSSADDEAFPLVPVEVNPRPLQKGNFHFYRQDEGGCWSHKPGVTEVTDVDACGRKIGDPRSACVSKVHEDMNYSDFCGCFCVSPGTITATRSRP